MQITRAPIMTQCSPARAFVSREISGGLALLRRNSLSVSLWTFFSVR